MASGKSNASVIAGIIAADGITTSQFLVAGISGSAAMLASGIHSGVDTANNVLLYVGQRRGDRPADAQHPFGHGMELYFWTLIVALLMFVLAGLGTMAEGVARVLKPSAIKDLGWNCAVLGIAACFNSYSWSTALRQFLAGKGRHNSFCQGLRQVKDPTVLTVLLEDSAALVSVGVAFLGVLLGYFLHRPVLDAAASILIGVLMATVAAGLIYQSKTLLVGETAKEEVVDGIRELLPGDEAVDEVIDLLTMQQSPKYVLLNVKVRFRPQLSLRDVAVAVDRVEDSLRHRHPELRQIFIEPGLPRDAA